jgi:hypothetical protein
MIVSSWLVPIWAEPRDVHSRRILSASCPFDCASSLTHRTVSIHNVLTCKDRAGMNMSRMQVMMTGKSIMIFD